MVEVTPGVKSSGITPSSSSSSTSSSCPCSSGFSIDAIISKDGGPVARPSVVPHCAVPSDIYSLSSHSNRLERSRPEDRLNASSSSSSSACVSPPSIGGPSGEGISGDAQVLPGIQPASAAAAAMDVLNGSHHRHPHQGAFSATAAGMAAAAAAAAAAQFPGAHPAHFPSSSPVGHPAHALLASDASGLFSAATGKPLYSSPLQQHLPPASSALDGSPHHPHSSLFGQSLTAAALSAAAVGPPSAAEASSLSALHALSQKGLMGGSLHGLTAGAGGGALPLPAVHRQFPLYNWLSRPGAYFHRYTGSEPSFLLPFRKPKRIRTAFSPSQLLRLEHAFEKNHYVVGQERKELAVNLSLTETQVKVWFQNRRTKHKRIKTEEEQEKHRKSSPDRKSDSSE